jgi:hypothetical protein
LGEVAATDTASGAAHSPQKRATGEFSNPHCAHRCFNGAAHCSQNFSPAGFSTPQLVHFILKTQFVEQGLGVLQVCGIEALGETVVTVGEHRMRHF